jgi:hypothetical protein
VTRAHARPRRVRSRRENEEAHVSLLFAAPLALVYHFGLLVTDVRNGADTLTSALLYVVDRSTLGYLALLVGLTALLYATARRLEARGSFHIRDFGRLLLEAIVLGFAMRFVVGLLTSALLAVPLFVGQDGISPVEVLVVSSGAGFHEELLFRGVLFAGGSALFEHAGVKRVRALIYAALISAVLFSIAHYVGPLGDPISLTSFVFRTLAGLYLAAVFHVRGFAVAAWTHAFYDVGVLM